MALWFIEVSGHMHIETFKRQLASQQRFQLKKVKKGLLLM